MKTKNRKNTGNPSRLHNFLHSKYFPQILLAFLGLITVSTLVLFELQVRSLMPSGEPGLSYRRRYALIGDRTSSFLNSVCESAKARAAESGDYVEFTGKTLDVDYSAPELMNIAVASRVDGIILDADDSTAMSDAIRDANDAGIPVICIGTDSYGSPRKSYVGISYYTLGQEYGKFITSHLVTDNVMHVLVIASPEEHVTGQNLVLNGLRDYISSQHRTSRFQVTSQILGDSGMFSTAEAVADLFTASSPGTLPDILVCLDETSTTSACQAIVDSNHVGDVQILGYSLNDTIVNALQKGIIPATLAVSTQEIGEKAVDDLNEYLDSDFLSEYSSIDISTVTAANLDSYLQNTESSSGEGRQS